MGGEDHLKAPRPSDEPNRFPDTRSEILADAAAGNWNEFLSAYFYPSWREVAVHCRMYGFSEVDAEEMLQEIVTRLVSPRYDTTSQAEFQGKNIPARFLAQRQSGIMKWTPVFGPRGGDS
jgi:hypothetical protein